MDVLINILNAISYAFILFVIASGLSLIFGVMGVLNLAHGALYMLGAYFGLTVASHWNNFFLAALLAAVGVGLVGLLLERVFLSRLYRQLNEQVLLTLGLVYIFTNIVLWVWGPWASGKMGAAPAILSGRISIGDFFFPTYRLGIILIGLALFVGLWWVQDKTRIGARIRAAMDDKEMTGGLGINYRLIFTAVFAVGATMGGLAGFLGTPIMGAFSGMGMQFLLLAILVIIIGGLGTVQGALLGSLVVGFVDTFGKAYFSDFAMFTIYLTFIIVLLVKPSGLLGRKNV